MKKYPYQNLSLGDLKGETWEDIPELDGYYLISNYGRVKRLAREEITNNSRYRVLPDKIIKPHILRLKNQFKKDETLFLAVRVKLFKRSYTFTIARLVYHCHIEHFDYSDINLVVIAKNTDNFDIRPKNLQLTTRSKKFQRTIERKRFRSPLLDISEEVRVKARKKIKENISKQVSQYNIKGKRIRTFKSMADAERITGVYATSIGAVAAGKLITAGGFHWAWGKQPNINVAEIKENKRKEYVAVYGQVVTQYDLSGNKIAVYPSVKDAAQATGCHVNAIHLVVRGIYKSAKGFYWEKGDGARKIDLSSYKTGIESRIITRSYPVKQYSLDGKLIQTFTNVRLAAESIKVPTTTLISAIKRKGNTYKGYKWKIAKPMNRT